MECILTLISAAALFVKVIARIFHGGILLSEIR